MDIVEEARESKGLALRAYSKFNNDWTLNLSTMVAFNALTSFFPLMLALVTLVAVIPSASGSQQGFVDQINSILPADVRSQINVSDWITQVNRRSGLLTVVSIVGLLWGGSNLFGAIENAFAIIFRVKTRGFITQKLVSILMVVFFAVLLPVSFASTFLVSAASSTLGKILPSFLNGGYAVALGFGTTFVTLFVLFLLIYMVVPNVPIRWRYAWRGAMVAAVVMTVVNNVFPYYAAHFLSTKQYGTAALATAIAAITWFWFFSVILLVGAQVNALTMGIGYWRYDLSRTLMEQAVPTLGGAPTAVEALRRTREPEVFETPVGLMRDEPDIEEQDTGRPAEQAQDRAFAPKSKGMGQGQPKHAPRSASGKAMNRFSLAADVVREALTGGKVPGRPRSEGSRTVPVGIAVGGVEVKGREVLLGMPRVYQGFVVIGTVIGLLLGIRGARRP